MEGQVESGEVAATTDAAGESASAAVVSDADTGKEANDEESKVKHRSIEANFKANLRKASALKTEAKPTEAPKVDAKPAESAQAATTTPAPEVKKESTAAVLPPPDMSPEEKAVFASADPKLQAYLSRRSLEMRQQLGAQSEKWKQIQDELGPIAPVVKEHYTQMLKRGKNVAQVVDNALRWDQHIENNPVTGLLDYAEAWGVSPEELMAAYQGRGAAPQQQQAQPQPQQPQQRSTREEIEAYFAEQKRRETLQSSAQALQSWLSSKQQYFADPGTAAQLEAAMAPVAAAMRAAEPTAEPTALLDQALEIVLRREQFAPLRSSIEARAAAEKTKAEAEAALRSSRSISGSPGSAAPKAQYKDVRENFLANLRR